MLKVFTLAFVACGMKTYQKLGEGDWEQDCLEILCM